MYDLLASISPIELARRIDHTNLKPSATLPSLEKTCREALEYRFRGCCIPLWFVKRAARILGGSGVRVVTVVGFPLGYSSKSAKIAEAKQAFADGADEIDVVMNVSAFKSGEIEYVRDELASLVDVAHGHGGLIKVIIETSLLTENEIARAARLVEEVGADYVKTNTGFGPRGVVPSDVVIIKESLRTPRIGIKAAGGIRRALDAIILIRLGADIIGTSSGTRLVDELKYLSKET